MQTVRNVYKHVKREQITPDARIVADLQADSLDVVEITMKSEDAFGITLPDDRAERIVTVGDLYEEVGTLLGRRQ